MFNLENQLAKEFNISVKIVKNTLSLINEGASIPFIARYRKDQTQGLSDIDLRNFQIRQKQLQELESNKIKLIEKLKNNKQLTSELKNSIQASQTKKTT
jgi:uncharacterized protein